MGIWSSADEKHPHLWVRIEFPSSLLRLDILHKTQAWLRQRKNSLFLAERIHVCTSTYIKNLAVYLAHW